MVKEKKAMVQMHDDQVRKIDKCNRVSNVLHLFLADVAECVNRLLMAEEIDIRLYAQDDIDRQ